MIATSDLLEQIQGLKARISRLGPPPTGVTLKEVPPPSPSSPGYAFSHNSDFSAPSPMSNLRKLGWRAKRILETGLDLTAILKKWQERGERNEPGLGLVLHPEEFSETVALADGSLRLLGLFPESHNEQNTLCEGLEIVLIHLRQRTAFWEKKWDLVKERRADIQKLMNLAEGQDVADPDILQSWRDFAGRIIAIAKNNGLWTWIDRSEKGPKSEWAETAWVVSTLAAKFGYQIGLSEKEIRSLVISALLFQIPHAKMPIYLHGKPVWDEKDKAWYSQWFRQQLEETPVLLRQHISADHRAILALLIPFVALQQTRPDRPAIGPLAALEKLEKDKSDYLDSHWTALVSLVDKEGILIEAGSLGTGLAWDCMATKQATKPATGTLPFRVLLLGPTDVGSQASQGPHWVSLAGGFDDSVKELTGNKRARWHIHLLAGSPGHP